MCKIRKQTNINHSYCFISGLFTPLYPHIIIVTPVKVVERDWQVKQITADCGAA